MKTRQLLLFILAFATASVSAQNSRKKHHAIKIPPVIMRDTVTTSADTKLPRPKLVVGIVVDQMRWDYLFRFYDRYGENGFKRMLNQGFTCDNTLIDYIPTVTAAGHTCVYTGSVPAIHGIAGNDFIIQATGKPIYCVGDTSAHTVGAADKAGDMSPHNLLTTTVTDELRLATNFRSKVIGIALKDRASILPAGHTANAAYWFDGKSGNWITSTYYMKQLPQWLQDFNAQKLAENYLKLDWKPLYPVDTYVQTLPDDSKYEGKFTGTTSPTLPVPTSVLYKKAGPGLIDSTPYGNTFTLDMAIAAINGEELGQHDVTDFLAISLSSPDYIGHQFGPNSVEIEDNYLRLDRDLASFFTYLDAKVGRGNYTVFLTADHGAAHNTAFMNDHGIPAGIWEAAAIKDSLNNFLLSKYKIGNMVLSFDNYQINFNNPVLSYARADMEKLKQDCIEFMEKQPGVAYAIDMQKAATAAIPEELRRRIVNGYSREHSGAIQIILFPGWYSGHGSGDGGPTGTTHGTWNPYDTHIPLVFMGWGVKHGHLNRETHMTDVAPTVAALLHIQMPDGCIGKPIPEVLK